MSSQICEGTVTNHPQSNTISHTPCPVYRNPTIFFLSFFLLFKESIMGSSLPLGWLQEAPRLPVCSAGREVVGACPFTLFIRWCRPLACHACMAGLSINERRPSAWCVILPERDTITLC
jgi:hypothetical protein